MEEFDYDYLDGLNEFCNNENALEQQIKKASEIVDLDLEQSSEEIAVVDITKGTAAVPSEKSQDHVEVIPDDTANARGGVSTRRTRRNARKNDSPGKRKHNNTKELSSDIVDLEESFNNSDAGHFKNNLSILSDTDSDNITIKVEWQNKIEKIQHRKYQKFAELMNIFAQREDCSVNDILFNIENKIISPEDTPHGIGYKFYDIICGRVVSGCNKAVGKTENKNSVMLKVQSNTWKKPLEISIDKNESFSILGAKLAEEMKLNIKDFTLIFDGEPMDLTETPQDLDFEGGELIDCKVKSDSNIQNNAIATSTTATTTTTTTTKRKAPARRGRRKQN